MPKHNPVTTRPRLCDAVVFAVDATDTTAAIPEHKCKKRVVKAGMCGEHYQKWVEAKEWRRVNTTRRKWMVMDGVTYYQTIAIAKDENAQPFTSDTEQCIGRDHRCPRQSIINYEKKYYCQRCFMREQGRLAKIAKKTPIVVEQAAA